MDIPHPKRCLVVIDLQDEFLSPGGRFRIHNDSLLLLDKLPSITAVFRTSAYPIFWIRSEYRTANTDTTDPANFKATQQVWDPTNFLAGTHTGQTPCCEKGSTGAEFPPDVRALIDGSTTPGDGENIVLTKTWYSAFKETALLAELQQREITDIFVCGLLTNVCVNATVIDACAHGFVVTLVEDCLGWRKQASHDRALRAMVKLGVCLSSTEEICPNGVDPPTFDSNTGNKLPELYYVNGSIPSWRVLMALHEKNIKFRRRRLLVMSDPKETRLPEFLALNHRGKAPVLVDILPASHTDIQTEAASNPEVRDRITINESLAILHYIEAYHNPAHPLLPPLTNRAAHACALARIQETENLRLIYDALEDAHFGAEHDGGKLDAAERTRLIKAVDRELDYWEVYAEKTAFIAGEEFGSADCAFFPILAYMVHRGFEWRRQVAADGGLGDAWPHLKAYYRVWERGGKEGSAQRSQPDGWDRKGKANIWKGTKNNAKGLYNRKRRDGKAGT